MLALEGVDITVAGRRLLSGVTASVETGHRLALLAPSGAGKTTLLRSVAGLVDPAAGRVSLDGRDGDDLGWPAWRRRVTYVAQQPVMTAGTVADNLRRPFEYAEGLGDLDDGRARDRLARLGLDDTVWEQSARTLSVGQQQRVALVRALGIGPEVLLLDEPTGALDEEAVRAVEALLVGWCDEGGAALVVTHDRDQAARLCTDTLDLRPHLAQADRPASGAARA